jgi:hypothetical protein
MYLPARWRQPLLPLSRLHSWILLAENLSVVQRILGIPK